MAEMKTDCKQKRRREIGAKNKKYSISIKKNVRKIQKEVEFR